MRPGRAPSPQAGLCRSPTRAETAWQSATDACPRRRLMARIHRAEHPTRGTFFAAVDPEAHHVQGAVAQTRLSAFVAPFLSEQAACEALLAAGAVLCVGPAS